MIHSTPRLAPRPAHAPWAALTLALSLALALGSAAAAPPPAPRSVQGMVTLVEDGETLVLTTAGQGPLRVRLRDIDAPEPCQPWGQQARAALSELVLNKVATLQVSGSAGGGLTSGTLMLEELNVNRFLVENGHAWSTRTRWDQGPLVKQEKMARALSRGLHATPGAIQPKEFKRRNGPCPAAPAIAPAPPGGLK